MVSHKTDFSPCELCQERFKHEGVLRRCPMLPARHTLELLETLVKYTPFDEWLTPQELAERYNYSSRHILRLARNRKKKIIAKQIDNRWFILRCSFEIYINTQLK